jgi:replicative DNA helicase
MSYLKTTEINPENVEVITNEVREKFNDKLNVSFTSAESGLNFFNPESHIQLSKIGNPTGFKFFDKTLGGGWNPKTLVVFQGRPKVGKSMVLSNIAGRAFVSGCNVGIATLELSDRKYMKRLGSMVLDIPFKNYDAMLTPSELLEVNERMKSLKENVSTLGELQVKEFPTGTATAIDVENYFLKVQQLTGTKFSIIIVDYINLMRPMREQGNSYEKIKVISEELRAVAIRNEWCVITATQIKRDAVDDQDLSMSDIAESFGLVHTVDSLFGLMRGPMEKRMKIKLIANRDGGYNESFKMFRMNYEFAKLIEETDPASEFYSDDDDTQSLENQMRNQYHSAQTTTLPPNLIPMDQAIQNFPAQPTPNTQSNYDDILNMIN